MFNDSKIFSANAEEFSTSNANKISIVEKIFKKFSTFLWKFL